MPESPRDPHPVQLVEDSVLCSPHDETDRCGLFDDSAPRLMPGPCSADHRHERARTGEIQEQIYQEERRHDRLLVYALPDDAGGWRDRGCRGAGASKEGPLREQL